MELAKRNGKRQNKRFVVVVFVVMSCYDDGVH